MFDLRKAPIARALVPFISGSLIGYNYLISFRPVPWIIIPLLWLLMILVYNRSGNGHKLGQLIFSVAAFTALFGTGLATGMMTRPVNPGIEVRQGVFIRGEIAEEPQIRKQNWTFEMNLDLIVTPDTFIPVRTNVNVYLKMPSDSILPAAGQYWQFYGKLAAIRNSNIPGSPDYELIMQRKNFWYSFFADNHIKASQRIDKLVRRKISAGKIRRVIWNHWTGNPAEISLLRAVCLGDRSGITDDMRTSYAHAGGMHLLAVSGLHVGLIWWVLHHSLAFTVRLFRREVFRALIVVSLLWSYAFVTGFSSSVCRSVTMFTFFTLSRLMEQRTHSSNGILLSAFILIVINPGRILDVGFQLSYMAILGIVTINPVFKRSVRIKNRVVKWAWELTGVSLSAQIATAPLVVFYFHQLPTYSIMTNLVAIPLLSLLIAVFVISVPFMALDILNGPFNWLLMKIGYLLNLSMEVVSSIPGSVIANLTMSSANLGFMITIVFLIMMMPGDRSHLSRYLVVILISAILVTSSVNGFNR